MRKAHIAIGGAATLVIAGLGHAAGLTVEPALGVRHAQGVVQGIGWINGQSHRNAHYQFKIRPSWEDAVGDADDAGMAPPQDLTPMGRDANSPALLTPAVAAPGGMPIVRVQTPVPVEHGSPFYAYLMSAGQYVLDVGTLAEAQQAAPRISPVPLPGALWLFASALVAFLGISSRHKF